ncbi:MAG TPA: LamG domain-containing protein, partial [Polyangiaceae bacterium]|nr:LamG domain-containing protein [Polyangiaceae bacterium]
ITASAPPLGAYTHVVGTYDGTVMRLFVNAASAGTLTDPRAAAPKDVPFFVGIRSLYAGGFKGDIDEVAVYDKALSPQRVQAHYDAATP